MKYKSISLSRVLFLVIIVSALISVYSYKSFAGFFSDTDLSITNDVLSFQKNNKYVNLTVTIMVNGTERIITDNMKWFKEKRGDSWKFGANVTIPNTSQGGFIANNLEEVRFKVDTNIPLRFFIDGFEYDDNVTYRFDFSDIFGSLYYEENETQEDGTNITIRRNVPFTKTVENGTGILTFNVSMMKFYRGQTIFLDPTIYIWDGTVAGEYTDTTSPYSVENSYNVVVVGDIAYVTSDPDDELTLLNISDPSSITTKSSYTDSVPPYSIDGPRGLQVIPQESGNGWYVYITSTNDDCFTILNVSDNYTITPLGSINKSDPPYSLDIGSGQSSNNAVFIDGDFAYIASTVDDGLTILNITNKSNPTNAGYAQNSLTPYSLDAANAVFVKDNMAYVLAATDDGVTILNVTDKSNIKNVSWYSDNAPPYSVDGSIDLVVRDKFVYITSQIDNGLTILNVSDNYTITGAGWVNDSEGMHLPENLDLSDDGNWAFVGSANATSGKVVVINVTNKSSPYIFGNISDYQGTCQSNLTRGVFYNNSYVYFGAQTTDCFFVARIWRTDEEYPRFSNFYDNNGTLTGSGTAMFNVSIWETNQTAFLEIDGANYSAQYTPSYCYQESANVSTSCGGSSEGNYTGTGGSETYDENYSSYYNGATSIIMTYKKPERANKNSTWQIKDSVESKNLSLLKCWDYNESYIILNASRNSAGTITNWTCYNNIWVQLESNSFSPLYIYEEGMVWDTSSYNVSLTLSTGTYPYYWGSWGNGTTNNYNISDIRYYTVNSAAPAGQANHTRNITLVTSLSPLITKKSSNTKHTSITSSLISLSGDIGSYIRKSSVVLLSSIDSKFRMFIKRFSVLVMQINSIVKRTEYLIKNVYQSLTINNIIINTLNSTDRLYPTFFNITDNNGSITGSGTAKFYCDIYNSNGTAFVDINGANYSANRYNYTWLDFDGINDNVTVPDSQRYSINNTGGLSISLWIYIPSFNFTAQTFESNYINYFQKKSVSATNCEWEFRIYNATGIDDFGDQNRTCRLSYYIFNSTCGLGAGADVQLNDTADSCPSLEKRWIHLVGGLDSTTNSSFMYVNGIRSIPSAATLLSYYGLNITDTNSNITIGRDLDSTAPKLNGSIDDIKIFNRTLNNGEIKQLRDSGRENRPVIKHVYNDTWLNFSNNKQYVFTKYNSWTNETTFTGWFIRNNNDTQDLLVGSYNTIGMLIRLDQNRAFRFFANTTSGTTVNGITTNNIWMQYALTFNNSDGNVTLYINGVINNSAITTARYVNPSNLLLGKRGTSQVSDMLDGQLDEFRMYNKILNSSDVLQLYQYGRKENQTILRDNLSIYYPMNEGEYNGTLIDYSGNNNDGIIYDAQWVSDRVLTSQYYLPSINGVVGKFDLNESSGTTIYDSSGFGNNGTIYNATWNSSLGNFFTASILITSGVYPYYWNSYGNGTNNNYNVSSILYYTVLGNVNAYTRTVSQSFGYQTINSEVGRFFKNINAIINYVTRVTKTDKFFRNFWIYFTINMGLSTTYTPLPSDTTTPWFETIPEGVEIAYNTDFPDPEFLANDDVNISRFTVNDSKFTITTQYVEIEGTPMWQGILKNATVIPVGNYLLNITINDTSNNLNSTIYSLNVTGVGAASYLSNASMAFQIQPVTTRKLTATRILTNSFNPVILIKRVFYGGKSIIQAIFITPINYDQANIKKTSSVNVIIRNTINKYYSKTINTLQNFYVYNTIKNSMKYVRLIYQQVIINLVSYRITSKELGVVYTYINNVRGDATISPGTTVNITGVLVTGTGQIQMYINGNIFNNGSSPITNLTILQTGVYVVNVTYTGNANYYPAEEVWTIYVTSPGGSVTSTNACLYKKYLYYNLKLPWIRETNCL